MASRSFLLAALSSVTTILGQHVDSNFPRDPQDFSNISAKVCAGRSKKCAVYIDVPFSCSTTSATQSHCPVVFALHGERGYASDFMDTLGPSCHSHQVVCVYPQAEEYGNGTGWNDGNKWGNGCVWRQWQHCTLDPNDGNFFVAIVEELRKFHFVGPLFAYGFREGGAQAMRLGANAGAYWRQLPFAGIAVGAAQMLSAPERSGPGPYNLNRPVQTKHMCYFGLHGEQEKMVAGGELLDQPSGADFVLMSYNETNHFWARYNGCTNKSSEGPVDVAWWHPESGWDKSAASDRARAFWQWGLSLVSRVMDSRRRHRTSSSKTSAALAEDWLQTTANHTVWDCPPGGRVEHLIVSQMTQELPWLLRIGAQTYFERVLQFFKQCAADKSPPPAVLEASPGLSISRATGTLQTQNFAARPSPGARLARKHVTLQVEASGVQSTPRH